MTTTTTEVYAIEVDDGVHKDVQTVWHKGLEYDDWLAIVYGFWTEAALDDLPGDDGTTVARIPFRNLTVACFSDTFIWIFTPIPTAPE
jgi:hypothetical protein